MKLMFISLYYIKNEKHLMGKFIFFIFISLSSLPILINYVMKRRFKTKLKLLDKEGEQFYHQLLAVDMKNFNCRPHLINKTACSERCSLSYQQTLQTFISSAKSSICLCMFIITLKSINYELIKAHRRGVSVRVITDKVMLETKPAQEIFLKLSQNAIPYKMQPSSQNMMHHKFCLIDKEDKEHAKMFSGSLNLTNQALCFNFDNLVLTNNLHIINRFSDEFEELWNLF